MSLKVALLACLCMAPGINAQELRAAATGLAVTLENIEGVTGINGLPVMMSRATGPAVPDLARSLIERWRESPGRGSVQILECCGWRFAGVVWNNESRVIQWRTTEAGNELLWSSARLLPPFQSPPRTNLPQLKECRWTTPVHGRVANRHFLQQSAYCELEPNAALERIGRRLAGEGWRLHRRGESLVQAERGEVQIELVATRSSPPPGAARPGSALMWIESNALKEGRP